MLISYICLYFPQLFVTFSVVISYKFSTSGKINVFFDSLYLLMKLQSRDTFDAFCYVFTWQTICLIMDLLVFLLYKNCTGIKSLTFKLETIPSITSSSQEMFEFNVCVPLVLETGSLRGTTIKIRLFGIIRSSSYQFQLYFYRKIYFHIIYIILF